MNHCVLCERSQQWEVAVNYSSNVAVTPARNLGLFSYCSSINNCICAGCSKHLLIYDNGDSSLNSSEQLQMSKS